MSRAPEFGLLALDLLLIQNRRPWAYVLCVLLGGLTVGITIGLLDVLVFHLDAISSQKTVSAGVDLAHGLLLLTAGALVATGRLHGRRKEPVPAGGGSRWSAEAIPRAEHRATPEESLPVPRWPSPSPLARQARDLWFS